MGLQKLNERFLDPELRQQLIGMFPTSNSNDVRFAINFYTSIGLGGLTWGRMVGMRCRHELRETLTQLKARKAMSWIVCFH